jgi:hypothetical protein
VRDVAARGVLADGSTEAPVRWRREAAVFVYLADDVVKGIPVNRYDPVNPGEHLGVDKVPSDWVETTDAGRRGKVLPIHFVNGTAWPEDALAEYLVKFGHAQKQRWHPPAGSAAAEADPLWRFREGAAEDE